MNHRNRNASHSACLALTVLSVSLPRMAYATPEFPGVIERELRLAEEPPCTICHVGTPARGTVQTPFGKYLRSRGLLARNDSSLINALKAAEGERQDSNGNGITDIDELKAGRNPNGDEPEFGCVGRIAPRSSYAPGVAALLVMALLSRRRRKSIH